MLDLNLIRENPEKVRNALLKRMDEVDFTDLLEWDRRKRELLVKVETLQNKRNSLSKEIAQLKKQGQDTEVFFCRNEGFG